MDINWEPEFKAQDYKINQTQELHLGYCPVVRYVVQYKLFGGGWSDPQSRECVLRPPAVAVVLYDPKKDIVVMIEQIRAALFDTDQSPWLLEIVAGVVETGESPEQCAIREALEEAGCHIEKLISACTYWVSPGISNERIYVFCGLVNIEVDQHGSRFGVKKEGEDIKVHHISREMIFEWINEGKISSGPALIGLQWLKLNWQDIKW